MAKKSAPKPPAKPTPKGKPPMPPKMDGMKGKGKKPGCTCGK